MRIGIITQPLRYNYGGVVQNWALQTVLKRLGHEVAALDPWPYKELPKWRLPFVYAKRLPKRLGGRRVPIHKERYLNRVHDLKQTNIRPFIDHYINVRYYKALSELSSSDFDALIVGSDQVWRPIFNKSWGRTIRNMFLDFAASWNVRRIAYAASFGTDEWEFTEDETRSCSCLLQKFDAVSVRESSGVELCQKWLGRNDALHVLDPTLLLDKEDYVKLVENSSIPKSQGNLMCYILDITDEEKNFVQHVADERHLIPFHANAHLTDKSLPLEQRIQPPVEQWLRGFMDAELVITDSFHACVFSIIFGKPFIVVGNVQRGMARYNSLLSMFGLEDHLLLRTADYQPHKDYALPICLSAMLSAWRKKSLDFLTSALETNTYIL